jgi:hypothetical protein
VACLNNYPFRRVQRNVRRSDIVSPHPLRSKAFTLLAIPLLMMGLSIAGCAAGGRGGVEVSGFVKVQGHPLEKGSIVFTPRGAGIGHRAASTIEGGRFHLTEELGPMPGEYLIEILDESSTLEGFDDPQAFAKKPARVFDKNPIPSQFNKNSTLVRTVTPNHENHFEFDLHW